MIRIFSLLNLILLFISFSAGAKDRVPVELRITESYLELHKGPAKEYRVEHVLLTGDVVRVKKQYADWFYLQQSESVYGWASLSTLLDNRIDKLNMSFDEFLINFEGDFEFDFAFRTGLIEGDILLGFEIAHRVDEDLRLSLNIVKVPGIISESEIGTLDIEYFFNRIKSMLPYLNLGVGQITNKPSAQVIGGETVSAAVSKLGLGLVFAESKRISFSAEWFVYYPEDNTFQNDLQEISAGLNYYF